MLDWLRHGSAEKRQQCLGPCKRSVPVADLVLANFCYHKEVDYLHRSCSGIRLLCSSCHIKIGTYAYYAAFLKGMAEANPDQYPWDDALIGLKHYCYQLSLLITRGVNPADRNELEIAWQRNIQLP